MLADDQLLNYVADAVSPSIKYLWAYLSDQLLSLLCFVVEVRQNCPQEVSDKRRFVVSSRIEGNQSYSSNVLERKLKMNKVKPEK